MVDITSMSLRQKIGQLMMIGFKGIVPSKEILQMIEEYHVGGIIFFGRNIGTPEEVLNLTSELQQAALRGKHELPLLISIDQENGLVRRLGVGTTVFPGNMLLGAVGDEEATREVAQATAEELKALGINMNLAPVLDINNNPHNPVIGVRSYGESVEDVTKHGIASIKGHHDAEVITNIKHFPGHGDTDADSHLALPVISHDLDRLEKVELVPFQRSIEAGADSVMIAHVYFPTIEPRENVPATISKAVVTNLLREKMGFNGVITTDCLEMDAISKTIGTVEGALQALKAGIDILMISHSHDLHIQAIERIVEAVESDEIEEDLIDKAVERVIKLKSEYLDWDKLPDPSRGVPLIVGGENHQILANRQYERGVTLVKDDGILPLTLDDQEKVLLIYPESKIFTLVEDERYTTHALGEAIRQHHTNVQEYSISTKPTDSEVEEVMKLVGDVKVVIFGTMNAHLIEDQAQLIRKLAMTGKSVIVIAMRNPYDLAAFPMVNAFLATYEYTLPSLNVASDIIFGARKPNGKLPVTIPEIAGKGFGL